MFMRGEYLAVMMPHHHLACKDGYVYLHRLNAEKKLGRKLLDTECVHHKDENKLNNELNNLVIFKTKADHTAFHMGCKATLIGDTYVCIDKIGKNLTCPICKINTMHKQSTMCESCRRIKSRKVVRPSKEKLLSLILQYPMTKVGEIFGVSNKAIERWCKSYDLPYKFNDIKNLRKIMK